MLDTTALNGLKDELSTLIERAYRAGFAAGAAATRDSILKAATSMQGAAFGHSGTAPPSLMGVQPQAEPKRRAPKGLADAVIRQVFQKWPGGMTMAELQERVTAVDNRVPPKTVANLLSVNKHGRYARHGMKWFLADDPARLAGNILGGAPRQHSALP